MKINSQELIQSYVLTTAKYNFSIYEKRILYKLIKLAQVDMQGKKLNETYVIGETLFKDKIIRMPINSFLKDEKDQNYTQVKKALLSLRNKTIEYENEQEWRVIGLIEKPVFQKKTGFVQFEVQPMIWKVILNFSKGFSKYELKTAMSFDSVYSMRFYELFSNNLQPLTFSIEELKKRFKIENKYKNKPTNFIKYVIEVAKKELDKKAPFSFNFTPLKTGRKITAIKFFPHEISKNKSEETKKKQLNRRLDASWRLPLEVINYLHQKYNFTTKGIKSNIELLAQANREFDLLNFAAELYPHASMYKNPRGYLIGAIRNYLKNKLKNQ